MIDSCEIMFFVKDNRDEEVCCAWDVLDHTYHMSESECFHYRQNWWITLNKSGEQDRLQGDLSQEMKIEKKDIIPMPTFARRPSAMSSLFPVDIPQNPMVGQQR